MALDPSPQRAEATDNNDDIFVQLNQPNFDAVQYLNDTLPTLTLSSFPPGQNQNSPSLTATKHSRTAVLQTTSTQVQTTLGKLGAHNVQSSSELTALADEMLRSGKRLTYEVEVLRGDVNGFWEVLTDGLKDEIARFVVEDVVSPLPQPPPGSQEEARIHQTLPVSDDPEAVPITIAEESGITTDSANKDDKEPDFIRQLRVLGTVKARLEAVIHAFGEALKWPIPPSDVSVASSLISVSAPELGVANSPDDDKAREYTRKLRNEITAMLDSEGGGAAGLQAATKRVNELRALAQIWKGTAEEKARTKVVDNLARLVEDRKKLLDARAAAAMAAVARQDENVSRASPVPASRAGRIVEGSTNTAAGLFRNLQKLRDEIYQD